MDCNQLFKSNLNLIEMDFTRFLLFILSDYSTDLNQLFRINVNCAIIRSLSCSSLSIENKDKSFEK